MSSVTENFPRGGCAQHRSNVENQNDKEKVLFKVYDRGEKGRENKSQKELKGVKRHSEPVKIVPEKKQKTGNVVLKSGKDKKIGLLPLQEISVGMAVLTCVQKVDNYSVKVGLPGGLRGEVPITAISDSYKEQLEVLAYAGDMSDVSENVSGLVNLFRPGMLLTAKVTELNFPERQIFLTINPKDVNHGVSIKNLRKDIVLFGCVSSCEDHGYMIDLGVMGSCAFLANKEAKMLLKHLTEGHPLSVGQSLWCRILVPEKSDQNDNRTVQVTVSPKKVKEGKIESSSGLVIGNLVPGMKVEASIKEVRDDGLLVGFLSYTGTIHPTHLPKSVHTYKKKEKISACILYINSTTKAISLSALPYLVGYSGIPAEDQFAGLSVGDVVEKSEITHREKNVGLYFKLPNNNRGFAGMNNLSDSIVDIMADDFKPGSKHKVRVTDFRRLDQIVLVSLKESVISQQFMQKSDIKPGMRVDCTVKGVHEKGVSVDVTNKISGFIPLIHLADVPIKNPAKLFKIGKKLKCRALTNSDSKLILTNKKSLVKTKMPIITSYEAVETDMELDGVIVKITENGVLVLFFNDVKGWATRRNVGDAEDANPTELFYIGQVIRCWVTRCRPEEQRITLSFKFGSAISKSKELKDKRELHYGEIVSCVVNKKNNHGLKVDILSSNQHGFLPSFHLDDNPDSCEKELKAIKVGEVVVDVLIFKEDRNIILSRKKGLLKAAREGKIIQNFDNLEVNQQHTAVVKNVSSFGVFVELIGGIVGLVPTKRATTDYTADLTKRFIPGLTVEVKIISLEKEKKRFLGTFLLEADDRVMNKSHQATGEIVKCQVTQVVSDGIEISVSGEKGFIPMMHLSDSEHLCSLILSQLSEKDELDSVMFFTSRQNTYTMKKSQLEAAENGTLIQGFQSLKLGQLVPGVVKNFESYGVFVEFAGGFCGLVPSWKTLDTRMKDFSKFFKKGQSVVFKVTGIDKEKKTVSGSLKLEDCFSGDIESSFHLLKEYLTERAKYLSSFTSEASKKLLTHKVGSIVSAKITNMTKKGVICQLDDRVKAYATKDHLRGIKAETGDKLDAVVIDVNVTDNCLEVVFDKGVVRQVRVKKDTLQSQAKVEQVIKSEVLLVKPDFVLVELKAHAVGRLAYIPAKKHLNDVLGPLTFSTDQLRKIVIKGEVDGTPVGVLHDWCRKEIAAKTVNNKEKEHVSVHENIAKDSDDEGDDDDDDEESDSDDDDDEKRGSDDDEEKSDSDNDKEKSDSDDDDDDGQKNDDDPLKCPFTIGDVVTAKIKKIKKFNLYVNIKGVPGLVHITEMVDKIENGFCPLWKYVSKKDIKVKVMDHSFIKYHSNLPITGIGRQKSIYECSVKPSKLKMKKNKKLPKEEQSYKIGDSVIAFVKGFSEHIMWMFVSATVKGRVYEFNMSEDVKTLQKAKDHFRRGQGYNATVIGIDKENQLELSLTGYREIPKEKCVTRGKILQVKDTDMVIQMACGYRGSVNITDVCDKYRSQPLNTFSTGVFVECYVLSADVKTSCVLSLRKSRINPTKAVITDPEVSDRSDLKKGQVLRGFVKSCHYNRVYIQLGRDIVAYAYDKHLPENVSSATPDIFYTGKLVSVEILSIKNNILVSIKDSHVSQSQKRKAKETEGDTRIKKRKTSVDSDSGVDLKKESDSDFETTTVMKPLEIENAPRISASSSFCWDEDFTLPCSTSADEMGKSDEDSEDENNTSGKKKKLKRKSQKEEEEMIFAYERQQLEEDVAPQTADDFDKLVLQSPDSSIIWLRYMAFHLETTEVDKARNVAERALKTISFREEQEKLNVWVAYLNLENLYGTPELLKKVFERAVQYNEPFKVYQQLVNIYIKSGKLEDAEQLYNTMVRRFSVDKDVWLGFCLFFFQNNRLDSARKLLQRSLKSLNKKDHVEMISKFAQLEFKHGEVERGRTMFESILASYPKRTDLWSVFIDMVIKSGDMSAARQLFERVINMTFNAKNMKFFFKKYVDFEKKYGDDSTVEEVKKKALDYVESQGYVEN